MENFWTSNKNIHGLRHFVLVNKTKEKGNITFLMVSVLDSEINLKITHEELLKSRNWDKGWINLPKIESITYFDKRKLLLDEIRKEYKEISKGNSEKTIKEK